MIIPDNAPGSSGASPHQPLAPLAPAPEAGLLRKHRPAPVRLNTNPLEERLSAFGLNRLELVGAKAEKL